MPNSGAPTNILIEVGTFQLTQTWQIVLKMLCFTTCVVDGRKGAIQAPNSTHQPILRPMLTFGRVGASRSRIILKTDEPREGEPLPGERVFEPGAFRIWVPPNGPLAKKFMREPEA